MQKATFHKFLCIIVAMVFTFNTCAQAVPLGRQAAPLVSDALRAPSLQNAPSGLPVDIQRDLRDTSSSSASIDKDAELAILQNWAAEGMPSDHRIPANAALIALAERNGESAEESIKYLKEMANIQQFRFRLLGIEMLSFYSKELDNKVENHLRMALKNEKVGSTSRIRFAAICLRHFSKDSTEYNEAKAYLEAVIADSQTLVSDPEAVMLALVTSHSALLSHGIDEDTHSAALRELLLEKTVTDDLVIVIARNLFMNKRYEEAVIELLIKMMRGEARNGVMPHLYNRMNAAALLSEREAFREEAVTFMLDEKKKNNNGFGGPILIATSKALLLTLKDTAKASSAGNTIPEVQIRLLAVYEHDDNILSAIPSYGRKIEGTERWFIKGSPEEKLFIKEHQTPRWKFLKQPHRVVKDISVEYISAESIIRQIKFGPWPNISSEPISHRLFDTVRTRVPRQFEGVHAALDDLQPLVMNTDTSANNVAVDFEGKIRDISIKHDLNEFEANILRNAVAKSSSAGLSGIETIKSDDIQRKLLRDIAARIVPVNGGILAADESTGTAGKRLESVGLANTPENRQEMRRLILTVPGQEQAGVSAVILYGETFDNIDKQGRNIVQHYLLGRGILPGIKTDAGLIDDPDSPGEKLSNPKGLQQLPQLLAMYKEKGAAFTKWRITVSIDTSKGLPTEANIRKNAKVLAESAKQTQKAGLVPIVEPEVLLDGVHDIAASYRVTTRTLEIVFDELIKAGVWLDGVILKTSMILSGNKAAARADSETVGYQTLKGLLKVVPAEVPAVVFLSGGQEDDEVNENLDAIIQTSQTIFNAARNEAAAELKAEGMSDLAVKVLQMEKAPWQLSYSFGRGLQRPGLKAWGGKPENFVKAQEALLEAARITQNARLGRLKQAAKASSAGFFRSLLLCREKIAPVTILHLVAYKGTQFNAESVDAWVFAGTEQEREFRSRYSKKDGYIIEEQVQQTISAKREISMWTAMHSGSDAMTRRNMFDNIKRRLIYLTPALETAFEEIESLAQAKDTSDKQIADKISELEAFLDLSDPEVRLLEYATTDPQSLVKHNTKASSAGTREELITQIDEAKGNLRIEEDMLKAVRSNQGPDTADDITVISIKHRIAGIKAQIEQIRKIISEIDDKEMQALSDGIRQDLEKLFQRTYQPASISSEGESPEAIRKTKDLEMKIARDKFVKGLFDGLDVSKFSQAVANGSGLKQADFEPALRERLEGMTSHICAHITMLLESTYRKAKRLSNSTVTISPREIARLYFLSLDPKKLQQIVISPSQVTHNYGKEYSFEETYPTIASIFGITSKATEKTKSSSAGRLTDEQVERIYGFLDRNGIHYNRLNIEQSSLNLTSTGATDISALKDMPLTRLNLTNTGVADISALKDMPLTRLNLYSTGVTDISALQGMPLTWLNLSYTRVADISALQGMPLTSLYLSNTGVADISALQGMPLTWLYLYNTGVIDKQIERVFGRPSIGGGFTVINQHGTQNTYETNPASAETKTSSAGRLTNEQIAQIYKFLDDNDINHDRLNIEQSSLSLSNTGVTDISALQGMPLTWLNLYSTGVTDDKIYEIFQSHPNPEPLVVRNAPHVFIRYVDFLKYEGGKSSSSGISLNHLSEPEAARFLLDYAPTGIIEVPMESQAVIVYSDSLTESLALQEIIRSSKGDTRKFYLVNKESDTSADELLKSLNIDRSIFQRHVFTQNSLTPDQLALNIAGMLSSNGIRQGRVFASTEEDLSAWSRQGIIEALVMMLKDKRFEIISDYSQQHTECIRTYEQALIAA